mmetsp:Transcript_43971/g.125899  ORF Transcript_43971/g.125899 Transcript_43971/m.125899 type:complete len:283 (+) Transcript_43971:94-942(+)
MSFALKPAEGSARLLGPSQPRKSGSRSVAEDLADKVQAHIQAVQRHAADIRKEAKNLSTARSSSSSVVHWKQVYRVGRDTVAETRRQLHELDPGASSSSTDDKKLQRLTHQKLVEGLEFASTELEQSWQEFVAAEAAWATQLQHEQQQHESAGSSSSCAAPADLEAGREGGLQLQEADLVAEAELDMHNTIANEYAREVSEIAQNTHALQRAMNELARHTISQGEMLEGIESQMEEAAEKTVKAAEQLQITEEHSRRNLKWTVCLMMMVMGVSAAVVSTLWK